MKRKSKSKTKKPVKSPTKAETPEIHNKQQQPVAELLPPERVPQECLWKLKLNFCRFCLAPTNIAGERDISDDFLMIFHHFYGEEVR